MHSQNMEKTYKICKNIHWCFKERIQENILFVLTLIYYHLDVVKQVFSNFVFVSFEMPKILPQILNVSVIHLYLIAFFKHDINFLLGIV